MNNNVDLSCAVLIHRVYVFGYALFIVSSFCWLKKVCWMFFVPFVHSFIPSSVHLGWEALAGLWCWLEVRPEIVSPFLFHTLLSGCLCLCLSVCLSYSLSLSVYLDVISFRGVGFGVGGADTICSKCRCLDCINWVDAHAWSGIV